MDISALHDGAVYGKLGRLELVYSMVIRPGRNMAGLALLFITDFRCLLEKENRPDSLLTPLLFPLNLVTSASLTAISPIRVILLCFSNLIFIA